VSEFQGLADLPPFWLSSAPIPTEIAIEELTKTTRDPTTMIYTDASAKDGNLGAAVVMLDHNDAVCRASQSGQAFEDLNLRHPGIVLGRRERARDRHEATAGSSC
jgi:hypothetical protein